MKRTSILILGSTGFFGRNILEEFNANSEFQIFTTSRDANRINEQCVFFDFTDESSWGIIEKIRPDIIINAAAYGVIADQVNLKMVYEVNCYKPQLLFQNLQKKVPGITWVQIGTAFEYELEQGFLFEYSPCHPKTNYGTAKWMFSNYLLNNTLSDKFLLIRPFGMFGPYENKNKFFPYLITAQLEKRPVKLSSGLQIRDYTYVKDVAQFICHAVKCKFYDKEKKVINVGSGRKKNLKELATILSESIPGFDKVFWKWDEVLQRPNESDMILNASTLAAELGLNITAYDKAFSETVDYYKRKVFCDNSKQQH